MSDYKKNLVIQAVEQGSFPSLVYKYRPIDDRTISILENSEFWFSNSESFNDPFDSNLSEINNHTLKGFKKYLKTLSLPKSAINIQIQKAKKNPKIIRKLAIEHRKKALNKYGILSLSKNHNNILMWSHYASSHTGIAIELNITKDPDFFIYPINMDYQNEYKPVNSLSQIHDYIKQYLSIKSKLWSYEEEIRILKNKPGLNKINSEAIQKIYFGCKTPKSEVLKVKTACQEHKHIEFYQGVICHGKFELIFQKL